MKYTNEVIINLPRQRVVELFDNPDNLKHWQPGLQHFMPLSGTPGQVGAKSKLIYQMGQRRIEMIETITKRDLPNEFSGTYEADGVWSSTQNFFTALPDNQTKITSVNEFKFTRFMRLLGWFAPGSFKKQSQQYLDDFKTFAESQKS